jgi:hypothetical protein
MAGSPGTQISSFDCKIVIVGVESACFTTGKQAVFGQFCRFPRYGQAGTGFALPGR